MVKLNRAYLRSNYQISLNNPAATALSVFQYFTILLC